MRRRRRCDLCLISIIRSSAQPATTVQSAVRTTAPKRSETRCDVPFRAAPRRGVPWRVACCVLLCRVVSRIRRACGGAPQYGATALSDLCHSRCAYGIRCAVLCRAELLLCPVDCSHGHSHSHSRVWNARRGVMRCGTRARASLRVESVCAVRSEVTCREDAPLRASLSPSPSCRNLCAACGTETPASDRTDEQ